MARWLGIDVSATMVRVALVRSSYRKTQLVTVREERLADHETPAAAIRSATTALRADACAAAIQGKNGFMRRVDLPRAAQKELESVLNYEVESTLPLELADAVMDHRRLKPIAGIDSDEVLPLFAAVAVTEEVSGCIDLVKRGFGIEPARVGIGPLPLVNLAQLARELGGPGPVCIVDLAETSCDVLVLRGGEPRFARSISRGLDAVMAEGTAALARDIRQTLAAWRAAGGEAIERVTVVGPGRAAPGIESFVAREIGVALAELPALGLDDVPPEQEATLARYAKAIALAMSLSKKAGDLNLRQGPLEAQQSFQFLREKMPILSGLAAAIVASFGFAVFAEMRALDAEKKVLGDELAAATKAYFGKPTSDAKEAADMLDAAIAGKLDDPMPSLDAFDVMSAMSDRIPQQVTHDVLEFDFKKNVVSVKGLVNSIEDAKTVETEMQKHECFKDVNLSHTTKLKEKNKQKYTLEFKIDCTKVKAEKKEAAAAPSASGSAAPSGEVPR